MGYDTSSILYITSLSDVWKHSLPIYQKLRQAIWIYLKNETDKVSKNDSYLDVIY